MPDCGHRSLQPVQHCGECVQGAYALQWHEKTKRSPANMSLGCLVVCHWANMSSAPGNTCGHLLQHQCHVQTAEGTQPRRQPALETSCRRRNPLPPLQHSKMTTLRVLMPLQTGMYEIQGSDVSWSSKGRWLQQLIKGRGSTGMRAVVAPWKIPSLGKTSC